MSEPNPVGRPLTFKTPQELQAKIDEYFDWCDNRAIKRVDSDGKEYMISSPAPYTMSGLARRIGLSRQGLIDYENRDEFLDTIREARERVHEDVETRLMDTRNEKGAIFNLKNNFKWRDATETDLTSKGEKLTTVEVVSYAGIKDKASV